jgi:hypothetical protein
MKLIRERTAKFSTLKILKLESCKEEQMRKKYQDEMIKQLNEKPQTKHGRTSKKLSNLQQRDQSVTEQIKK